MKAVQVRGRVPVRLYDPRCVHVRVCVCVCKYVRVCMQAGVLDCSGTFSRLSAQLCMSMYACVPRYMCACMCVYVCPCLYMSVPVSAYYCTFTCVYKGVCPCARDIVHTNVREHVRVRVCVRATLGHVPVHT